MSVNNSYRGKEQDVLACDKFALTYIDPDMFNMDLDLFETKWWDYRTMHPATATAYFMYRYRTIEATYISKYVDSAMGSRFARYAGNVGLFDLKLKITIRAMWKARQRADAIGMPYDMYIKVALDNFYENYHKFSTTKGGKQDKPYATQLSSDIVTSKAIKEWEEIKALPDRMIYPESEQVLFKQVWFRPAMEKDLIDQMKSKAYTRNMVEQALKIGALIRTA